MTIWTIPSVATVSVKVIRAIKLMKGLSKDREKG